MQIRVYTDQYSTRALGSCNFSDFLAQLSAQEDNNRDGQTRVKPMVLDLLPAGTASELSGALID